MLSSQGLIVILTDEYSNHNILFNFINRVMRYRCIVGGLVLSFQ